MLLRCVNPRDVFHIYMLLFPANFADIRISFTGMTKNGYTINIICKSKIEKTY